MLSVVYFRLTGLRLMLLTTVGQWLERTLLLFVSRGQ